MFILETFFAANKFKPTGGDISPISMFTVIIIPKCIGSIPKELEIGKINGATIKMIELGSINWPKIISTKLSIIRNSNLLNWLALKKSNKLLGKLITESK